MRVSSPLLKRVRSGRPTSLKVPAEAPYGATMIGPLNAGAAVGTAGVEFHHVYRYQIDEQSFGSVPLGRRRSGPLFVRLQIENRKRDDKDLTDLLLFRGLGELGVTGISSRSLRIKGRGVPVAEGGFQRDAAW